MRPRRRREDVDLAERLSVVEAIQEGHQLLLEKVSGSLESLVRIEADNAIARQRSADNQQKLETITIEMPGLRIVRQLVFTAVIALLGSCITVGWVAVRELAKAQLESRQNRAKIAPTVAPYRSRGEVLCESTNRLY